MYVSEVVYGRVILVLANSSLTSSEVKMALKGDTSFLGTTIDAEAKRQKTESLHSTSIRVLNWGGKGEPDKSYSFQEFPALLTQLKSAKLTPETAMPIAFKARWLADHTSAEWVGITPLRTYVVKTTPMTFDLSFDLYNIRDDHDGLFRGEGDLFIAAAHTTTENTAPDRWYKGHSNRPGHHLFRGQPVFGETFDIAIRQGEEDGQKITDWKDIATSDENAYGERFLKIDLRELLKKPNREWKAAFEFPGFASRLGYESVGDPFPGDNGGNGVFLTVRLNAPPPLPELKVPEAKNATTEFDRKAADSR